MVVSIKWSFVLRGDLQIGGPWFLDKNGVMDEPDEYKASSTCFILPRLMPKPGLPAQGILSQKYLWHCPSCDEAKRQVSGPTQITWTMQLDDRDKVIVRLATGYNAKGEPLDFTYGGPAYITNLKMNPSEIPADGKSTSEPSVTILPGDRKINWSILAPGLGCKINKNTGVVTSGTTPGKIKVQATDSRFKDYYSIVTLKLH